MRVLVLVLDAFGGHGGIARGFHNFLKALCTHPACQEVVAVPRYISNPIEPLPAKLTYVTSGLNGKLNYTAAVSKVACRNSEFDLIVCGHIYLLPVAFLLRLWVRAPIVLVVHGIEAWEPTGKRLADYLARRIDAFISVSEVTKQRFLKWTKLSANTGGYVLPSSIDLEDFSPGPKNIALVNKYNLAGKIVLMTLGRLVSNERYKGFDEILELLPILIEEIPNIVYLVGGDGSDRRRLEAKARSLDVADRVVFTGMIPEAEKADHYRLADAFVMPSRGEGLGLVFFEAMASGVPVVASKVDGSREAVRDGALGIVVDPEDQEDVKAGILEALDRPNGLVPDGLNYFSYTNFERRLHHIINKVLARWEKGT